MQDKNKLMEAQALSPFWNIFYKVAIPFLIIYLLVMYWFGMTRLQLSSDAGYYLTLARDIARGSILYKDIHCGYSPLAIYYFSLFIKVNINSGYSLLIGGQIFLELISGFGFYFIARKLFNDIRLSLLITLLFLISIFYNEGYHIMLEPMVVLFILWSMVSLLYYQGSGGIIISGLFAGCAFLSKQYGILCLFPLILYIILNPDSIGDKIKKSALLIISCLFIIACFFLYKFYFHDISLAQMLNQLFPKTGKQYDIMQNKTSLLFTYLFKASVFIYLLPLITIICLRLKLIIRDKTLLLIVFSNIVFLVPLYIIQFTHYNLLFLPFAILLFGVAIREFQNNRLIIGPLILLMLIYIALPVKAFSSFIASNERVNQYELSYKLKEAIPRDARVALYSSEEQYFLADLKPCDPQHLSYAFIPFLPGDEIYRKADFVVFDTNHVPDTNRLKETYSIFFYKNIPPNVVIFKNSLFEGR